MVNENFDPIHTERYLFQLNYGGSMKNDKKDVERKKFAPPLREVINYPILGLQIFIIALLFSNVKITYIILLMIGVILVTSILKNHDCKTD
jgi:hypothetical protein